MKFQKVVRTYPRGYSSNTGDLQKLLSEGYVVLMANVIKFDSNGLQIIEYILEKDNKENK